jgi:hypothetical protein
VVLLRARRPAMSLPIAAAVAPPAPAGVALTTKMTQRPNEKENANAPTQITTHQRTKAKQEGQIKEIGKPILNELEQAACIYILQPLAFRILLIWGYFSGALYYYRLRKSLRVIKSLDNIMRQYPH